MALLGHADITAKEVMKDMTMTMHAPVLPDGAEFDAMRKLAGYTIEQTAQLSGVARSNVQAYIAGRTPTRSHAVSGLAKAYRRFCTEAGR